MLSDAGIARLLTELDHEPDATCARLGCDYPAPVGPYCGYHRGVELAARDGGKAPPERTYNETRRAK